MFEKALNHASIKDTEALTQVIMLATATGMKQDDPIWERAERVYLQWLIHNEITNRKQGRSFRNILDLLKQGHSAVEPVLKKLPEWSEATENFRTMALKGLEMRVNEICLSDEHLRSLTRGS